MGYDLTRFVGEIDEDFQCSICSMVFENPVQTPCEHTFCNECIRKWLANNATCPIDRKALSQCELKTPGRLILNLLAKLDIKCYFGCQLIVKLDKLQDHLASCKYNPNLSITCANGCNMKIRRCEYEAHNCIRYLTNRMSHQEDEITKLTCELIKQHESFRQQVISQEQEIKQLKDTVRREKEQNTELSYEMRRLKEQNARRNEVVKCQQESVPEVRVNSTNLVNKTPKWGVWKNVYYKSNI